MKQLIEDGVMVNNKDQDAIIEYYMEPIKEDGLLVFANINDSIVKCNGSADEVLIYLKDGNDLTKVTLIKISSKSIKKIYAHILEIEKLESEEFYY